MNTFIREFRDDDADALRACVIALQDFERTIDPRLRPGEIMADAYCDLIHARCRETEGRVYVAELEGAVVGFVAVRAYEPYTDLDDPPGTYALVSDLAVLPTHQGRGIGRLLLNRAEAFARDAGASELRVGVLSRNTTARRLYLAAAFAPHLEILAKPL
jgi:GNAT superfamily N-acetyltransferase